MKVSLGGSVRENQGTRANFQHLQSILEQNLQMNFITALKVSPPPISVLTTQTVLTDRLSTIHRSPKYSFFSRGKKAKATTKVTLCKPLRNESLIFSKTLIWLQLICLDPFQLSVVFQIYGLKSVKLNVILSFSCRSLRH